ncbi:MAG: threonine synthase [Bacteroidales bacterium]
MKYYNVSDKSDVVDLRDAVLGCPTTRKVLYMPFELPDLSHLPGSINNPPGFCEIALAASQAMFKGDVPESCIEEIVNNAFTFEVPLVSIDKNIFVLELFHGPTLAFKDFGARFMSGLFRYLNRGESKKLTILVATSGDTGGAVADAFSGSDGIDVVILYPSGGVSPLQEKQLTTHGGNVSAIEVSGTFDDCQSLARQSFADPDLGLRMRLVSANSINFARLFPQSFYYMYASSFLKSRRRPLTISVPSGNFGNLTAGLMAYKMGTDIQKFVAACNSNRSVVDYLETGVFNPAPTIKTVSNAMDVGNPGNFPRMLNIFNNDLEAMKRIVHGYSCTDDETLEAMRELESVHGYLSDPHGAVAYRGLKEYLDDSFDGVYLATAHPSKFPDVLSAAGCSKPVIPGELAAIVGKPGRSIRLPVSFNLLKEYLLSRN